jgi:hypothetical protein
MCVQACRRAEKFVWEGEPPGEPNLSAGAIVKSENFSAVQEYCPSEKSSTSR